MTRCDLPVESCGKALEQRQRADAARQAGELRARGYFPATYRGACQNCGEYFDPGTLIRFRVTTGWTAECCA